MRYFLFLFIFSTAVQGQHLASSYEYSQRGMTRFEQNDFDGAIADFTKVIEMNGQNLEFCYYFRGMSHYRKGNPNQAIADLSKAIELKPHPRFYDDRGNLLARQGELDRAIADFTKAIEIAPQYAKAYGDRAIVHLMRGEDASAEVDFKKCFAIDSALEAEFRAAVNKVKRRTVSPFLNEKPVDVEVLEFSWTEAAAKVLIAPSSAAIPVSSTPVSASGTRVLANPSEKGEPGPPIVAVPAEINAPPPRESASTRDVMEYKFTTSIRNKGNKTIIAVKWAYVFEPKDLAQERLSYLFTTRTNIKPGKEKTLKNSLASSGGPKGTMKLPHKANVALFNERVAIVRLEYEDGSSWESSKAVSGPQNSPQH